MVYTNDNQKYFQNVATVLGNKSVMDTILLLHFVLNENDFEMCVMVMTCVLVLASMMRSI